MVPVGRVKGGLAYLAAFLLSYAVSANEGAVLTLPSGLDARLQEMLWDRPGSGLIYRFRFVADEFSPETADFEVMQADLEHLCNAFAMPKISNVGPEPGQVIISLADRESEFGVFDPDVAQVFEAFKIENDSCVWEAF